MFSISTSKVEGTLYKSDAESNLPKERRMVF